MNPADMERQVVVNLSQTQKIATQFREADTIAALAKAAAWMASLRKSTGFTIAQRYDNVDLLDTATRAHQKQIGDNYLSLLQANRKREKELWEAAYGFWTALSGIYLQCVEQASADPVAAAKLKAKLPLMAARGARAAGMRIKWISFRFGLVESSIWKDLARCLSFAEEHGFADKSLPLYLSNQGKSSVNEEFLHAAMLFASTTDSLTVMEQEIVDRWAEHFAGAFVISGKAGKGLNLCFDVNGAQPPRRVIGAPAKGARLCYFGATEALPQIQEYIDATKKTGVTPVPFRLPKGGEPKHVVKTLEHLLLHWGEAPPAREWDRRLTAAGIEIRHDFGTVFQTLAQVETGELDFTGRAVRPEFWIVDNAGRGGYRAIVPKGLRAWLRLGALIAMRLEFRDFWSVAVIRRVESDEHQQRKVGIRMISRKPVTAMMHSKSTQASVRLRPQQGILLNTRPSREGGVHVLMRPGTFTLKDDIEVTFGSEQTTMSLTPSRLVETAVDYEWIRYTLKK